MTTSARQGSAPMLPATLRLGPVHLTVTDLDRAVEFYERAIGLHVHRREAGVAVMGTGRDDLLFLYEERQARPAGRHAGLYHFALLHPSRLELARAAHRLLATSTPISGASDHGISEAIYLPDPDGNGIELAADRPPERWGDLSDPGTSAPNPLDLRGLLELVDGERPQTHADAGLVVGHLHLHVGDIEGALRFYRDVIGFELMTGFDTAVFLSAGGYHHHVAANTWRGVGVSPVPPDAVGLRHWTVVLDGDDEVSQVRDRVAAAGEPYEPADGGFMTRDPWRNALLLTAG